MRLLLLIFILLIFQQGFSQRWVVGSGLTYCSYVDSPGINLSVTYRLAGNLYIGPDFSALLTRDLNEAGKVIRRKEVEYNLNFHHLFDVNESVGLYPLVGMNVSKVTNHPDAEDPRHRWVTGLNAGGGLELTMPWARLFVESKYVFHFDKVDLTAGFLFDL
ncbi:MAG TPA: hypothetical protein VFW11_16490 [Cyclobacteriaceae bacterium]|nr:hypothetical protein [Cyclobacteriaceae bacterium]